MKSVNPDTSFKIYERGRHQPCCDHVIDHAVQTSKSWTMLLVQVRERSHIDLCFLACRIGFATDSPYLPFHDLGLL